MNEIKSTEKRLDEKVYFKLPISKDIVNGLVKIKVSSIINKSNCNTNNVNLYIT